MQTYRDRLIKLIKQALVKWENLRNDFLDEKIDDIDDFEDVLADHLLANYEEENKTLKAENEELRKKVNFLQASNNLNQSLLEKEKIEVELAKVEIEIVKAEAYQEFANNIEKAFSKTESQMPNNKVVKQTVQICRNAIRLVLNELVGDSNNV